MNEDRIHLRCTSCGAPLADNSGECFCQIEAKDGALVMPIQLSTSLTFYYKFVMGPVLIAFLSGFVVLVMVVISSAQYRNDYAATGGALFFATGLIMLAVYTYWAFARLKKVEIDGANLVISNFIRAIEVPLCDVESVTGSLMMGPEIIWIRFNRSTGFGQQVVFAGKWRMFYGFTRHPIVQELLEMVANAQGGCQGQ